MAVASATKAMALAQQVERDMRELSAQQRSHEAVCMERWREAKLSMDAVVSSVKSIWWLILTCAGVLIIGMAGLIVTLALHH